MAGRTIKHMQARFTSKCVACAGLIYRRSEIVLDKRTGEPTKAYHDACFDHGPAGCFHR